MFGHAVDVYCFRKVEKNRPAMYNDTTFSISDKNLKAFCNSV